MTAKTEKQGKREGIFFFFTSGWTDDYSSAFNLCTLQGTHKEAALLGK